MLYDLLCGCVFCFLSFRHAVTDNLFFVVLRIRAYEKVNKNCIKLNKGSKKNVVAMQQKKHFRLLKENCEEFLKNTFMNEWTNEQPLKKMCNENVPWMLKVLQGTIDASKSAALCLFCLKPIGIRIKSNKIK